MTEDSIQRFMSSQAAAKRLIDMDNNGSLDGKLREAKKNGKAYTNDEGFLETNTQNQDFNLYETKKQVQINPNSKLPKEILESFAKNNIDTSSLGVSVGQTSVLDQVNKYTNGKLFNESHKAPTRQVISEDRIVNNSIDYDTIKTIVEDCVKKYTSALKKSIITENKSQDKQNNLRAMKLGEKFSFIDDSGNLYEAKLKFIKNINE